MFRILKNNQPTSGPAQVIAVMAIALGSLVVTLFPDNPDQLIADTESVAPATGIRLQRPQFGTSVADSEQASGTHSATDGTPTPPRTSQPIARSASPEAEGTNQPVDPRRYEADGRQMQLIYKSLRPDVEEHSIQILPRQPHTSVHEQIAAAHPFHSVSQAQVATSDSEETLTLPAFQLPDPEDQLPRFELPESLPPSAPESSSLNAAGSLPSNAAGSLPSDAAGSLPSDAAGSLPSDAAGSLPSDAAGSLPSDAAGSLPHGEPAHQNTPDAIRNRPMTEPVDADLPAFPLFDPAVLNEPAAPDVLATMPRVFAQDSPSRGPVAGPPGRPVTTPSLPALSRSTVQQITPTPAPIADDVPLPAPPIVEDTPPVPIAPGVQGYEPPLPGDGPSEPVPGLPLNASPGVFPIQPVPDPLPESIQGPASRNDAEIIVVPPGLDSSPPANSEQVERPAFGHSFFGRAPGTSGFRATVEADADRWMEPYKSRVMATPQPTLSPVIPVVPDIPADFEPWWTAAVRGSMGVHADSHPVDVSSLLQDAMVYSPQVIAIKAEPEVQYRVVAQEMARFDWTGFLETTYDDLNDPVGSDLTTGNGEDRLLTRKVLGAGGFRRRTKEGGEFRFAQEIGHENQNSRFFVPNNQGSTRLELSYRQPLLDGAGRTYNESEIVLARIQANTSEDEVVSALQDHLTEVTEAYWTLYRARAEFFQRQKLLASAQDVLDRLEGRSKVDTIPRQVLRARAAVARARTRIQRTLARVKDAEAQLRLRVNSPYMLNGGQTELLPTEPPGFLTDGADVQTILHTALANRPDISEAIRRMRAAGVRLGVSRNELLPRLDFLVETYVADLAGSSNVYRAFQGQFADNRPGYTLGLEFEVPLGNRAAQARYEQRQWELKRAVNIFRATVEKSLTDVEIANREVQTAHSEILSRYQSMLAADRESRYLLDRFEVLPSAEDSATLLLEDLLDSFERLADEEASFVQAEIDHAIALIKLRKEMGTLLRSRNSRPKLDGTQQAWVSERLQSSAGPSTQNLNSDLQAPLFGDIEPLEPATDVEAALDDPTNGNIQIGYSIERPAAGPARRSPATAPGRSTGRPQGRTTSRQSPASGRSRSVPIPLTPTTWRRLPSDR